MHVNIRQYRQTVWLHFGDIKFITLSPTAFEGWTFHGIPEHSGVSPAKRNRITKDYCSHLIEDELNTR